MFKNKLLTIVVPVYNMRKYLNQCLNSMIIDGYLDVLEVLVIDDGSTDCSAKIAQSYARRFPNTFFYYCKKNGGVGSVLNMGITLATGKYIKEVDSDDWLYTEALKSLLDFLRDSKTDLIITPFSYMDYRGKVIGINYYSGIVQNQELGMDSLLSVVPSISIQSLTVRTKILKNYRIRLREVKFYIDMQFVNSCIAYCNTIIFLPYNLYRYRVNLSSQSISLKSYITNRECFFAQIRQVYRLYHLIGKKNLMYKYDKCNIVKGSLISYSKIMYAIYLLSEDQPAKKELQKFDSYLQNKMPSIFNELENTRYIKLLRHTKFNFYRLSRLLFKKQFWQHYDRQGMHIFTNLYKLD